MLKAKRERRVVALSRVRAVLKKLGKEALISQLFTKPATEFKLKRYEVRRIEEAIDRDGVCIVKRKNSGRGVILFGEQHIKWKFNYNNKDLQKAATEKRLAMERGGAGLSGTAPAAAQA